MIYIRISSIYYFSKYFLDVVRMRFGYVKDNTFEHETICICNKYELVHYIENKRE